MNNWTAMLMANLVGLTAFNEFDGSLDENLQKFCVHIAEAFAVDNCSIMLLDEGTLRVCANHGRVLAEVYKTQIRLDEGVAGYVVSTGKSLLLNDIDQSGFAKLARHPDASSKALVSSPMMMNAEVLGVINLDGAKRVFDSSDRLALEIAASFAVKIIQVIQLKNTMHSQFAMMALTKKEGVPISNWVNETQYPEKMAKILARSFYKEMLCAGFGSTQILNAASEIISELGNTLHRHKTRFKRGNE